MLFIVRCFDQTLTKGNLFLIASINARFIVHFWAPKWHCSPWLFYSPSSLTLIPKNSRLPFTELLHNTYFYRTINLLLVYYLQRWQEEVLKFEHTSTPKYLPISIFSTCPNAKIHPQSQRKSAYNSNLCASFLTSFLLLSSQPRTRSIVIRSAAAPEASGSRLPTCTLR